MRNRPVLRYYGGKWRLAPWIISLFPEHRIYVEPYAGAASVLMRKERSYAEVINDLDGEVVNVFRVLRDPEKAARLAAALHLTAFAREEFTAAYEVDHADDVEHARRSIALSLMGWGSDALLRASAGFRAASKRIGTTPAHDWSNYPAHVPVFVERLRGVVIENRPALDLLSPQFDSPATLYYVDPPYPHATRSTKCNKSMENGKAHGYKHEMTDDDHRELAAALGRVSGRVVISGYACELYDDELYRGWERFERTTVADRALKRTEVIWRRP